jgi:hypothetical protein
MKTHRYFYMLSALVAISFLAAVATPTTSYAVTWNCQPTKAKALKAKTAKKTAVRYAKLSNGGYKRQVAQNQANTLQKPICVQCSTGYAPNWGTVAAAGSGTAQQNNPPVLCSTCVPAWSLPATSANAPAATTASGYPVCGVPTCSWNTPATAGTSATYTPPPPAPAAPATTTTTQPSYSCGGLLCSILAVPYNIGAFVFGGCPMGGCS